MFKFNYSKTNFYFIILPVLFIISGVVVFGIKVTADISSEIETIISRGLTEYLNAKVEIGKISFHWLDRVTLDDVAVYDVAGKKKILTASHITANLSPNNILTQNFNTAIQSISIYDLKADIIRYKDGKTNLSFINKISNEIKKPKTGSQFRTTVLIKDSNIHYRDNLLKINERITHLNARINRKKTDKISINTRFDTSFAKKIFIIYQGNTINGNLNADVKSDKIYLKQLCRLLPKSTGLSNGNGIASGYIGIKANINDEQKIKNAACLVKTSDANIKYKNINMNISNSYISYKNNIAKLFINGKINKENFVIKGNGLIRLNNLSNSYINLTANMKNINLKTITNDLRPVIGNQIITNNTSGTANIHVTLSGIISNPSIAIVSDVNNGVFNKYKINNGAFLFNIENKRLRFKTKIKSNDLATSYIQGIVENIDFTKLNINDMIFDVQGNLSVSDISKFIQNNIYIPQGKLDVEFEAKGKLNNPTIVANASFSKGTLHFNKENINNITITSPISFSKKKGLVLEKVVIKNLLDANIMINTAIKDVNDITLNIFFSNLNFKKILNAFNADTGNNIDGTLAFLGALRIKNNNLYINGDTEIYDLKYKDYSIDYMKAIFNADKNFIDIKNMTILTIPSTINYTGIITNPFSKKIGFRGNFKISNINASSVFNKLKLKYPISGNVDGAFAASGIINLNNNTEISVDDLYGAGKLEMNDFLLDKYPFDYMTADIILDHYDIYLNNLDGRASNFNVIDEDRYTSIDGYVSCNIKTKKIDGNINLNNINISDFQEYTENYATFSGTCNLNCNISGTLDKINLDLKGIFRRMSINGKTYRNVSVISSLVNSTYVNFSLNMQKELQQLNINLKDFNLKNKNIGALNLNANNISAVELLDLFSMSPFGNKTATRKALSKIPQLTGGLLNLTVSLSGKPNEMSGESEITGGDIVLGDEIINKVTAKIEMNNGIINMPEFKLESTEIMVSANAFPLLGKDMKTNIDLSIINVPLSKISNYYKIKGISGKLACDAVISGNIKSPEIMISADIQDPALNNIKINRITTSKITLLDDSIDVQNGIQIMIGDYSAEIKGKIPWDYKTYSIPDNKPIDMAFIMDNQDLTFLETLIPKITPKTTKGTFDSKITLSGTIAKPNYDGYIKISNGEIHSLNNINLQNINSDININNTAANNGLAININSFYASDNKNKDSAIEIKKDSKIELYKDGTSNIDLECNLNNYFFAAKDISNMKENISANIDGKIIVTGNIKKPIITNNGEAIKITNLSYSFSIPKSNTTIQTDILKKTVVKTNISKTNGFNPSFDLAVNAYNAYVYPPFTKLKANATATLKGDLNNPIITGNAVVSEGRVLLQVARLRITKGSRVDFSYYNHIPKTEIKASGFTDVRTYDKLGSSNNYRITVDITGPLDNMNINMKSDPEGLSDQEMISAVGKFGIKQNEAGENVYDINVQDTIASVGISTIISPIEDFLIENVGIDLLSFDYKAGEYAIINVEKNFGRKFFLSFYNNFYYNEDQYTYNNISEWELKAGTRLWNRYKLTLGINSEKEVKAELSVGFSF